MRKAPHDATFWLCFPMDPSTGYPKGGYSVFWLCGLRPVTDSENRYFGPYASEGAALKNGAWIAEHGDESLFRPSLAPVVTPETLDDARDRADFALTVAAAWKRALPAATDPRD